MLRLLATNFRRMSGSEGKTPFCKLCHHGKDAQDA
jgi:hypothetical protein